LHHFEKLLRKSTKYERQKTAMYDYIKRKILNVSPKAELRLLIMQSCGWKFKVIPDECRENGSTRKTGDSEGCARVFNFITNCRQKSESRIINGTKTYLLALR